MSEKNTAIHTNLKNIRESINRSALACNRDVNDIQLLAVSKTKPVSDIVHAYNSGQRHFGENYVQEGVEKIQTLKSHKDIVWHFIGPLQSNKSRLVAENFDWMHCVDRVKIAKRLHEQRPVFKSPLNVCIQVNIDEEDSKAGVLPNDLFPLLASLQDYTKLNVRGLMAIPIATDCSQRQKQSFERIAKLYLECQRQYSNFDTLSMGMSGDMQIAIEYGSTMVRVGTAIFGKR